MILGSVILTGGKSKRMGEPKESLALGDTSILGHVVDTLLTCTWPVLVVARSEDQELPPIALEAEIVYDENPGLGPLEGLRTALQQVKADKLCDAVFLTGCDNPFPDPAAVEWLSRHLDSRDAVLTKMDDVIQPLCAVYRIDVLDKIGELMEKGESSLQALVAAVDAHILGPGEVDDFDPKRRFLRNINTREDYENLLRDLGS